MIKEILIIGILIALGLGAIYVFDDPLHPPTLESTMKDITLLQSSPRGGQISIGDQNFVFFVSSDAGKLKRVKFELIDLVTNNTLAINETKTNTDQCTPIGCFLYLNYNIKQGDIIQGRYYVDTTGKKYIQVPL